MNIISLIGFTLLEHEERPEGRTLGISIDEQHLLINFLNVYSILLQERKNLVVMQKELILMVRNYLITN